MEEENHSSLDEKNQEESTEALEVKEKALEVKEKKAKISYIREVCNLPQTRMRALIKSKYPELCIEEDALIGLTKATELLVQELASGAAKQTKKNIVKYEDVANFVANDKRWGIAVLQAVLPPQRTFADIKNVVFNKKVEEEDKK